MGDAVDRYVLILEIPAEDTTKDDDRPISDRSPCEIIEAICTFGDPLKLTRVRSDAAV